MIYVTKKFKRPSADISWHLNSLITPEIINHFDTNYVQTGKLVMRTTDEPDLLTLVEIEIWDTETSYNEFKNDQVFKDYWIERDNYLQTSGIIADPRIEENL